MLQRVTIVENFQRTPQKYAYENLGRKDARQRVIRSNRREERRIVSQAGKNAERQNDHSSHPFQSTLSVAQTQSEQSDSTNATRRTSWNIEHRTPNKEYRISKRHPQKPFRQTGCFCISEFLVQYSKSTTHSRPSPSTSNSSPSFSTSSALSPITLRISYGSSRRS